MLSAVIDACVLYSAPLRGLLLNLATVKSIRPFWTDKIHDEWIGHLLLNRPDLSRENLEQTRRIMELHFPSGLVQGYEPLISTLQLPDPKDQHVLAAAIHINAKYIVTSDQSGFPKTILESYDIEALSPDEFISRLIKDNSRRVLQAVRNNRLKLTRPAITADQYIETLEQQKLFKTVEFLRQHKDKI
jgi:predicted nucleic acid-binding protein